MSWRANIAAGKAPGKWVEPPLPSDGEALPPLPEQAYEDGRAAAPGYDIHGLAHIQKGLINAGVPLLRTELNARDAFKAVFSFQQTLDGLSATDVPNLDKAKLNVWELVHEVVERLKGENGGRKEKEDEDERQADLAGVA